MAWNEPGGGNRDPWGGPGRDQKGPPDLDEVLRKLQARFGRLFGGRRGGDGGGNGSGAGAFGIGLVVVIVLAVWLLSGFYMVTEGKRAVVLRFGQYSAITTPGLGWHWPYPIETVRMVDIESRRYIRIGEGGVSRAGSRMPEGQMLTQDENLVNVNLAVQWQVSDPRQYLFSLQQPEATLKQLTDSAVREVVGKRTLDFVLTEGRADVAEGTRELVQAALDRYEAGIRVLEVAILDVQPPEEVQAAFADVTRAREDEQRAINEARTYQNQVLPQANGEAARILEEAEAYKASVVAEAQGESARFLALLSEYRKAPAVMRERLYLEAIESVLGNTSKALVDVEGGQPLMYLPLDKMLDRSGRAAATAGSGGAPAAAPSQGSADSGAAGSSTRSRVRSREIR